MPTVVHVTGARPNFPKAAPVIHALEQNPNYQQLLVHTGQHYDKGMSDVFFEQLGLPKPAINLGIGSGSHAEQTARVMVGLETYLTDLEPDLLVVYGDVNSTVAAALVAAKLNIRLAHVEAGLRSFDRGMPEEINRVVVDQLSDILLVTSAEAMHHLAMEGRPIVNTHFVGNPMIDTLLRLLPSSDETVLAIPDHDRYGVLTLHRPSNVDSESGLRELVPHLLNIAERLPLLFPLHPRAADRLRSAGLFSSGRIQALEPLAYLEFVALMRRAALVISDSGGVQEETTILNVPCLTLRENTERPVTITHGTNQLVSLQSLTTAVNGILQGDALPRLAGPPPLWDGQAGQRIGMVIQSYLG